MLKWFIFVFLVAVCNSSTLETKLYDISKRNNEFDNLSADELFNKLYEGIGLNAPRRALDADIHITSATMLFGTISNSQKLDPSIFQVWTNILRQVDGSRFVMTNHSGVYNAMQNLKVYGKYFGISSERVCLVPLAPWIDHIYRKTAFDVLFDTATKNGHTTGLDGIWAGVPVVSLGNGNAMPTRAAESIASSLENEVGITYSLKEYEDFVVYISSPLSTTMFQKNHLLLHQEINRNCKSLLLLDDIEIENCLVLIRRYRSELQGRDKLRILKNQFLQKYKEISQNNSKKFLQRYLQVLSDLEKYRSEYYSYNIISMNDGNVEDEKSLNTSHDNDIQDINISVENESLELHRFHIPKTYYTNLTGEFFEEHKLLLLNIGGNRKLAGWLNINANSSAGDVDIVRNMDDLEGFTDHSVVAIYSSHTLEHNCIGDGSFIKTLREWNRVLKPGGLLLLSVPNLRAVLKLYLDDNLTLQDRWMATLMIYGSQSDDFDYHMIGFDEEILSTILLQVGFCSVERVNSFNLFTDTSDLIYKGYKISLNVAAKKCVSVGDNEDDIIDIQHHGSFFDRTSDY